MLPGWSCSLRYEIDGRTAVVNFAPEDGWQDEAVSVTPLHTALDGGAALSLEMLARRTLKIVSFLLRLPLPVWVGEAACYFVNGYQSWSRSECFRPDQRQSVLTPLLSFLRPYTEPGLGYAWGRGRHHGWTHACLRDRERALLLGSLDERPGFTILEIDWPAREIGARKDCAGRVLTEGERYRPLDLFLAEGREPGALYAAYARACGLPPMGVEKITAWLSWYYYYTKVSSAEMRKTLAGLRELALPLDYVLLDDGYEAAVGDWLTPNERFPGGVAPLADEIRAAGFKPGIWLAPFVAEKRSALLRDRPDWFLREPDGRLVKAGWNDNWSGTFHALDLQNPEARTYIAGVTREMTAAWGFELLKVDFAYAACLRPTPVKTRGELMAEAVDLLKEASAAPLLGCGIPLGSSWGRMELCRVGADVAPYWNDPRLALAGYGERVATENALRTVLGRSFLNRRFFRSDPDVFFLRQAACRMSQAQKRTLFLLAYLCGSVFGFSDPPDLLGEEERILLRRAFPAITPLVLDHIQDGNLHELWLEHEGDAFLALANLGGRRAAWPMREDLAGRLLFDQMAGALAYDGGQRPVLVLAPYETRLFKITDPGNDPEVIGTTLHLLGGRADVAGLALRGEDLELSLRDGAPRAGRIWLGCRGWEKPELKIDGKAFVLEQQGEFWVGATGMGSGVR